MDINDVSKNQKPYAKYSKLIDTQKELLKVYLNENSSISNIEARNRLEEETGLEANITAVGDEMKKLRKLANLYNNSTNSDTPHTIKKDKTHRYDYKIKDEHIEHLKIYLQRNIYISSEEAKNRLYRETGLEIGNQTLQRTLEKLKKEIESEHDNFGISTSASLTNDQHRSNRAKLKDTHLALLKQYLKENSSISPEEASDKLRDETDLLVSAQIVQKAINRLKEETSLMHNNLDPSISTIKTSSKSISNNLKVKEIHIDLLKKYLRENRYIGPTEAKNLLHKETSLEISIACTSIQLKRLREEMGLECANLDTSIIINGKFSKYSKIKDPHLACLKNYLKKDRFIGHTEAMRQLYNETGFQVSSKTVGKHLESLRKEMFPISTSLHSSSLGSEDSKVLSRINLKIMHEHKESLKKYLREDKNITASEANGRLHKETGLDVSNTQVGLHLKRLRKEMGHKYNSYYTSFTKNRMPKYFLKIKDFHLECLKTYLKKDKLIRHTEAMRQLHNETGLQVSAKTVAKAMRWLRNKMRLDSVDLDTTMVKSRQFDYENNLKDTMLAFLKKYLNNNRFIGPVDAMNKLREETGLDVDILAIHHSLKMLKKEASLIT